MTPRTCPGEGLIDQEKIMRRQKSAAGSIARDFQIAKLRARKSTIAGKRKKIAVPLIEYQNDPVGFAEDVLGINGLSRDQISILNALAKNTEVSVSSGNGVGKSFLHPIVAWWRVCCWDDSWVLFTSTVDRQVLVNMWQPFCTIWKNAKYLLGPQPGLNHHRPWVSENGKCKVLGGAPKTKTAVLGTRGKRMAVLPDEASGIRDDVNDGLQSLVTGEGSLKFNTGNPTTNSGWFADKFKAESGHCISMSCLDSPNVVANAEIIPGLVSRKWVEDRRKEWGEDDPRWKVHVLGQFLTVSDLRVFSPELIELAKDTTATVDTECALRVGVDLAGKTENADRMIVTFARGMVVYKFLDLTACELSEVRDAILQECADEVAYISYDAGGVIGKEFGEYWLKSKHHVTPVYANARAVDKNIYPTARDEMPFVLKSFITSGGRVLFDHAQLFDEMAAINISYDSRQRIVVEHKEKIRKRLRCSPDHYDSLALCIYDWGTTAEVRNVRETPAKQGQKRRVYGATGFGY